MYMQAAVGIGRAHQSVWNTNLAHIALLPFVSPPPRLCSCSRGSCTGGGSTPIRQEQGRAGGAPTWRQANQCMLACLVQACLPCYPMSVCVCDDVPTSPCIHPPTHPRCCRCGARCWMASARTSRHPRTSPGQTLPHPRAWMHTSNACGAHISCKRYWGAGQEWHAALACTRAAGAPSQGLYPSPTPEYPPLLPIGTADTPDPRAPPSSRLQRLLAPGRTPAPLVCGHCDPAAGEREAPCAAQLPWRVFCPGNAARRGLLGCTAVQRRLRPRC